MNRLFKTHKIRRTVSLDGLWSFSSEGKDHRLPVPGCWEQHPALASYRGQGEYKKTLDIEKDGSIRLEFKGVSHTARVYLDGEFVVEHYNAFTPFSAVIPDVRAGEHELRVEVDNSFGEHSALHVPNDYYTYGGITRPVELEYLPGIYIKYSHFTPYRENGLWKGRIETLVENISGGEASCTVAVELAGQSFSSELRLAAGESRTAVLEGDFPGVSMWSCEEPQLYLMRCTLIVDGNETDDLIERVGFRTVAVKGERIYLNDEPVYLIGFNRHEDYAEQGCAVDVQHMAHDMELMRDMGANAVRTCHYPNDERFLDMCDEYGMLVWEENHARGLVLEAMQNPNFDRQCEDCIREMIENHYNHPSIVIWGILNECASETEEGREKYARQYSQIRSLDTSRPTTSATCRHFTDICLDLEDIVSFNMYSGWYKDVSPKKRNDEEIEWIKRSGGNGKPIIVSEVGAAAIYGYRDRSRCKWSEERQSDIIRENLDVYLNDDRITGVFIWQFADCRVTEEGDWFATRARCHNNKGVLDEYRRPKMAYDTVKELFWKKQSQMK